MTSTNDQTQPLVDAIRARIADPSAYLPRIPDTANSGETAGGWAARAISAGLADGSLGVNICSALCADIERDRDDYEGQLGDMRAQLSAAEAEVDRLRERGDKLAATLAAIPDAHHAANLAHARVARDRYAAIVNAARTAAERLLRQEQQHSGSGRDGHLNEDDLVPLFEALGVVYLDGDTDGLITAPAAGPPRRASKPGDRVVDGGVMGTLVRCPECGGGGLLHQPDEMPETAAPKPEPADRLA